MILSALTDTVVPPWVRWAALCVACGFIYLFGIMRGERIAGERHIAYVTAQAAQTVKIAKAQTKVVIQTEIKYHDRIQTIYITGQTIEQGVRDHVTKTDDDRCVVNNGFVRIHTAAWSGNAAGSATEPDDGPSGIPLSEVAEAEAHNAASCLAWREQAIGLREFYKNLQQSTNTPSP